MKTLVIIPSRMSATRLPGKPLLKINGLSIISHVSKKAEEANIGDVIVATEDQEIIDDVRSNVILTAILTYMASEDENKASREKRVMPISPRTGKQAVWPKKRAPRRSAPNN